MGDNKMKKVVIFAMVIIIATLYFSFTSMPTYEGQLSIDISNTTFKTVKDVTIEYEESNKIVQLPDIKPLERVIIILPDDIYDNPLKTRVFINYNGEKEELLGEYHSLSGAKYNTDVIQYARVSLKNKGVKILDNGLIDIKRYFNFKPYFRVIDLNNV